MSADAVPGVDPAPRLDAATRLAVARLAVDGGHAARLAIRGGSMLPTLREPMAIDVRAPRRRPRTGDVLVFRDGDAYVAHRVVGRAGAAYLTSGDAQPEVVERVAPATMLGLVEAVWSDASPEARRVDTACSSPPARGVLRPRPNRARARAPARRPPFASGPRLKEKRSCSCRPTRSPSRGSKCAGAART